MFPLKYDILIPTHQITILSILGIRQYYNKELKQRNKAKQ